MVFFISKQEHFFSLSLQHSIYFPLCYQDCYERQSNHQNKDLAHKYRTSFKQSPDEINMDVLFHQTSTSTNQVHKYQLEIDTVCPLSIATKEF